LSARCFGACDAADLQAVAEAVPDEVAATFVPANRQPELLGRRVGRALVAGEFLTRGQLGGPVRGLAAGQRLATIPVSADLVTGLALTAGDQVEIVVNDRSRPDAAAARVVVPQATVYEVGPHDMASGPLPGQSGGLGSGRSTWLAVLVDDTQFQALAQAPAMGDLAVALPPAEAAR
jgi:Flp pilus assembly protein CpaB